MDHISDIYRQTSSKLISCQCRRQVCALEIAEFTSGLLGWLRTSCEDPHLFSFPSHTAGILSSILVNCDVNLQSFFGFSDVLRNENTLHDLKMKFILPSKKKKKKKPNQDNLPVKKLQCQERKPVFRAIKLNSFSQVSQIGRFHSYNIPE